MTGREYRTWKIEMLKKTIASDIKYTDKYGDVAWTPSGEPWTPPERPRLALAELEKEV